MSSDDRPDEEGNASRRDEVRFGSEKVTDLVDWEPDCR